MATQFRKVLLTLNIAMLCVSSHAVTSPERRAEESRPIPVIQTYSSIAMPSQPDKRGTSTQPLFIQSLKDEAKETDDHSIAVWTMRLGIATILLVAIGFSQLIMFWRQLRLMVSGAEDTRIAALAAKKSSDIAERSLTQLERPHVLARVRRAGLKVVPNNSDDLGRLERSTLELVIYNFGRTPAQLTHLEYNIDIADHESILAPVDRTQIAGRALPVGTISANDDPFIETTSMQLKFLQEESDILRKRKSIWIVGFVRYTDLFGNHHVSGFAETLDVWSGKYVRRGDETYNYTANERESDIPAQIYSS